MEVGSSRIRSPGFMASVDARFRSCFCPPDSSLVFFRYQGAIPKNDAISATLLRIT